MASGLTGFFTSNALDTIFGLSWIAVIVLCYYISRRPARWPPLPPGPKPLPIIGNALQLPTTEPHLKYREWRQKYGDIVHATAGNKHIVILNSPKVINDLLEKRGRIYSDRPGSLMVKMAGLDDSWTLLPYGRSLRLFHKLGRSAMGPKATKSYETIQEEEARLLASNILSSPLHLFEHVEKFTSDLMLRLLYGYSPSAELDHLSKVSRKLGQDCSVLFTATSQLLDLFPILQHVPAWFPVLSFQKVADDLAKSYIYIKNTPFQMVKKELSKGDLNNTPPCNSICAALLKGQQGSPLADEEDIKRFLGSTYPPGQETTTAVLTTFFLVMANYPEVQQKAREEVISVVGIERLPRVSDKDSLIYLKAVFKELLRWHSPTPMGLPHVLIEEDTYEGMRLPKGSMIFANIWEVMHDPHIYPEPSSFRPERFLEEGSSCQGMSSYSTDPYDYVFGFGRRACPGAHLAQSTLLITMATVLVTCDISPLPGISYIQPKFTDLLVTMHPLPFKCSILPRCKESASLCENLLETVAQE
ncbi:hypothetical protein M422DRAFT_222148 [Sphaerobolus stellatus SS14]|nr:hypothetical protein M422DRAFT_222148 [Sphaerobolus stellatus SS14]